MINFNPFVIYIARAAEEAVHEVASAEASSGGVAGTLGLNLTYFIGQLITFSIVLFVLWKWVFTPVAKKLTERTERVEKAMRDAASTEKEKQEFEKWKAEQMVNARHEASLIVGKAQTEATAVKDQILQTAKLEQEKVVAQAKAQIEQEKNQALATAKGELADLVTNATEKILRHKLDEKKDNELVKEMLKSI